MPDTDTGPRWGAKASAGDRAATPVANGSARRASKRDLLAIIAGTVAVAGLGYALSQPGAGGDGVTLRPGIGATTSGADLVPVDGNWNAMNASSGGSAAPAPAVADIPLVASTELEHIVQTQTLANVMMPRLVAGEVTGFTIREGSMPPVLARAGIRAGDVMVSVNGRALDSNAVVSGLSRDLVGAARAIIVVERGGGRETLSASLRD